MVGIALIAIEIFVIPGFGVAGILGLISLFGGIFMAMLGRDIRSPDQVEQSAFTVVAVLLLLVVGWGVLLLTVPRRTRFGGTVLQSTVDGAPSAGATRTSGWLGRFGGNASLDAEYSGPREPVSQAQSLVGVSGIAVTPLHPSGTAEIGGSRIDVVAEGDFIDEGDVIVVVLDEGYRRVVQRAAL
ncbi:hypothetical protein BH09CHL1_BH09CHL1_34740 [soil metagenome]